MENRFAGCFANVVSNANARSDTFKTCMFILLAFTTSNSKRYVQLSVLEFFQLCYILDRRLP